VSRKIINVGSAPLAGDGEQLRDALIKINDNFEEVYNDIESIEIPTDVSDLTDTQGLLGQGGAGSSILPYLELTNNPIIVQPIELDDAVSFEKANGATGNTAIDFIDDGIALTRGNQNYLYNPLEEESVDRDVSPIGTLWNRDGWGDLSDYQSRDYGTFDDTFGGNLTEITDYEIIMYDTVNNKYYTFDFTGWTQGQNGGGFAYTRRLIIDPNIFVKSNYGSEVDIVDTGLQITRGNQGWLYNPLEESQHDDETPTGTLWNTDGWNDLSNITSRTYLPLRDAIGSNFSEIAGTETIMYDTINEKYYAIKFLSWTANQNGGGFSYARYSIDLDQLQEGIRFADGSILKTAKGIGRVKSTAPGNRGIEEAVGYKSVSVTASETNTYEGVLNKTTTINFEIYVTRTTELDEIILQIQNDVINPRLLEISLDGGNTYNTAFLSSVQETEYWFYYTNINNPVPQVQGDPVSIRITAGGDPVVWWDKRELPGGADDFRGAIIDYHAYTGDGTIIGTIHIADDDGDEHITHTEVSSGDSNNLESNDLWVVNNEGRINYRRLDGQAKTLKIHWTAKVFYGSETYD
jgi:hypothetical protein